MDDLVALKRLASRGVIGVIIGKALYDGRIELADALRLEDEGVDGDAR